VNVARCNLHERSHHRAPRSRAPPVSGQHFSAVQPSEVWHLLCQRLSVCLVVHPYVCRTRESRLNSSRYRSMRCTTRWRDVSSFWRLNLQYLIQVGRIAFNRGTPLRQRKLGQSIISRKRCKIGCKLLLFTHRKSHTCVPLVPKLVTLNDVERRNGRYFALFCGIRPLPRTYPRKILAMSMISLE